MRRVARSRPGESRCPRESAACRPASARAAHRCRRADRHRRSPASRTAAAGIRDRCADRGCAPRAGGARRRRALRQLAWAGLVDFAANAACLAAGPIALGDHFDELPRQRQLAGERELALAAARPVHRQRVVVLVEREARRRPCWRRSCRDSCPSASRARCARHARFRPRSRPGTAATRSARSSRARPARAPATASSCRWSS